MTEAPLLHVGYIKTATTFLQQIVFNNPRLGFGLPCGRLNRSHLVQEFVLSDDFLFDAAAARARLDALAAPLVAQGLTPVWSEETLVGDPIARRYDAAANLAKLRATFPGARVVISIREQRAIALSMYREYVKGGGTRDLSMFVGDGHEEIGYEPIIRPGFMDFWPCVARYREAFGPQNVLIMPYELLVRDPQAYLERLTGFLGRAAPRLNLSERRNVGLGSSALAVKRLVNRAFVRTPLRNDKGAVTRLVDRGFRAFDKLAPRALDRRLDRAARALIEARYAGRFREGNRRLAEAADLPLGRMGWDCG